ncbi:MAG: SDR family NAD(P)-dependent oxidoreductase [Actinophytocola sp.]|uniref:SDR family NAD(P)-dependent oxidoreductase n=1 Tax=Actinophytocola sp. TaxID=1872138 RepID=UPI003C746799
MAPTDQHKIGSGFGVTSTAAEVVDGIDLTGKLAVVTGGYSGIGIETTKALADAGAFVVVPARRTDTAAAALAGLSTVEVAALDLGDLGSVRRFADDFLASGRAIDIVINSAGVMACPETRIGPGWEAQFATNHLGHFALVNRLWRALSPGARVVAVSSAAHRYSGIRWDDVMFARGGYDKWLAYGQSKTANSLFAVHLDRLARDQGVCAFSLHPGGIHTPLQRHLPRAEMIALGIYDEDGNEVPGRFKSPEQGAATQVWAATSRQLADFGGLFLEDCDVAGIRDSDELSAKGVYSYAVDPDEAARLWDLSVELTGVNAFTRG